MNFIKRVGMFFLKRELQKERYQTMIQFLVKWRGALEGKKSYVLGGLALGAVVTSFLGFISPEDLDTLLKIFGAGFSLSFAAKVNRLINVLREVGILLTAVQPWMDKRQEPSQK
ncbi:MAG: hypothetical protein HY548_02140 [Elusimicrobia bacterium]|nr:hypothetical protein [Elusimicrobiota bacterium]